MTRGWRRSSPSQTSAIWLRVHEAVRENEVEEGGEREGGREREEEEEEEEEADKVMALTSGLFCFTI